MGLNFREATLEDLPRMVTMLADDELGATREVVSDSLPEAYTRAFHTISADANNQLLVAENDGELAGFLQLTFIPGLTFTGRWRAQVEGVRVDSAMRGQGVGEALLTEAIRLAGEAGCCMVQLTSNKQRGDALRFYEKLGFTASHEGFKLYLR